MVWSHLSPEIGKTQHHGNGNEGLFALMWVGEEKDSFGGCRDASYAQSPILWARWRWSTNEMYHDLTW